MQMEVKDNNKAKIGELSQTFDKLKEDLKDIKFADDTQHVRHLLTVDNKDNKLVAKLTDFDRNLNL